MIGHGSESSCFVLELTYNYGVTHYPRGQDLLALVVESALIEPGTLSSPDGYEFEVRRGEGGLVGVVLAGTDLARTRQFWAGLLGLAVLEEDEDSLRLAC